MPPSRITLTVPSVATAAWSDGVVHNPLSGALIAFDKLFCRQPNVLCDLPQQSRRDITPVTELLMGASLANLGETQALE
jgi:hypothetical protein